MDFISAPAIIDSSVEAYTGLHATAGDCDHISSTFLKDP